LEVGTALKMFKPWKLNGAFGAFRGAIECGNHLNNS